MKEFWWRHEGKALVIGFLLFLGLLVVGFIEGTSRERVKQHSCSRSCGDVGVAEYPSEQNGELCRCLKPEPLTFDADPSAGFYAATKGLRAFRYEPAPTAQFEETYWCRARGGEWFLCDEVSWRNPHDAGVPQ